MEIVLVICLVIIALGEFVYLAWREKEHIRQVDELTNKLVARSLGEYASAKQVVAHPPAAKADKPKVVIDPVLGEAGKNW